MESFGVRKLACALGTEGGSRGAISKLIMERAFSPLLFFRLLPGAPPQEESNKKDKG